MRQTNSSFRWAYCFAGVSALVLAGAMSEGDSLMPAIALALFGVSLIGKAFSREATPESSDEDLPMAIEEDPQTPWRGGGPKAHAGPSGNLSLSTAKYLPGGKPDVRKGPTKRNG